jgi:hypothetical protein
VVWDESETCATNCCLFLNAFGADRRRKSESAFRTNTPRVRNSARSDTTQPVLIETAMRRSAMSCGFPIPKRIGVRFLACFAITLMEPIPGFRLPQLPDLHAMAIAGCLCTRGGLFFCLRFSHGPPVCSTAFRRRACLRRFSNTRTRSSA